jgi:DNA-binding GntR family transcriptional regulator
VVSNGLPRWRLLAVQIESEIRTGTRSPGSRLPSLTAQQAAGYSQTTALRAYQELISRRLAVSVHGSGTYVCDPLPEDTSSPAGIGELLDRIRQLEQRVLMLEQR